MAQRMDFTVSPITVLMVCLLTLGYNVQLQAQYSIKGLVVDNSNQAPLTKASVFLNEGGILIETDKKGRFAIHDLSSGNYTLNIFAEGFGNTIKTVVLEDQSVDLQIGMDSIGIEGPTINVTAEEEDNNGIYYYRAVEGMGIYISKKHEIIDLEKITANLSNNNSRQIYNKVAGLNIWENDNSGLQLNIGGRGLSPNRTSNFNTRQNGYDISADALGYPEAYYTPPAQALQKIEIIRGAASLQYGTQFGGMLNFKLKEGAKDRVFELRTEQTYGSFHFFNSFNSIGGSFGKGKFNYYGYYQFKRGDGWRPFSKYRSHNGFFRLAWAPNERWHLSVEHTTMNYLAQQPGGVTDLEFMLEPRQAKRPRNWFGIQWDVSALNVFHRLSDKVKIETKTFLLQARRESLGNLQPINRPDYGAERDLIKGKYTNIGNETRLMYNYKVFNRPSVLLTGIRIYKGFTQQAQGTANADSTGTREDFQFINTNNILKSDYQFPSFNIAAFAENYFAITPKWSVTPGFRYEYINTMADGYYQNLVVIQGPEGLDTLRNDAIDEERQRNRSVFLLGIGSSYKFTPDIELYTNFSQNYKAINFNDMRIINPNQAVDSLLQDERGFNTDLGIRGRFKNFLRFDATIFYLSYRQRIGNIQDTRPDPENPLIIEPYTLRTNIGDARVFGIETLIELDIAKAIRPENDWSLVTFCNFSWLDGRYTASENTFAIDKRLEFVAPVVLRTGLNLDYKGLSFSYQYSYTAQQFSDATNAEQVPNAVVGIIPAYGIMDLTIGYTWKNYRIQGTVSNLTDERYFSRRASSYPGPGIIPADGISFYISLQARLGSKPIKGIED